MRAYVNLVLGRELGIRVSGNPANHLVNHLLGNGLAVFGLKKWPVPLGAFRFNVLVQSLCRVGAKDRSMNKCPIW